jgi:hypothetical protein
MNGIERFWLQADDEAAGEHPLERELAYRVDALVHYREAILDAEDEGRESALEHLVRQHDSQETAVGELRVALERMAAAARDAFPSSDPAF